MISSPGVPGQNEYLVLELGLKKTTGRRYPYIPDISECPRWIFNVNLNTMKLCSILHRKIILKVCLCPWRNGPPEGAVSEGLNSPPCARGSARFHRFSYSSSNFSMATAMLC